MTYFQEKIGASVEATNLATMLMQALKIKRKMVGRYAGIKSWANCFERLLNKQPLEEVAKTLKWYCEHLGEEFVPACGNASTFCLRYLDIVRAMARTMEDDVSETDRQIAQNLTSQYSFPIEVLHHLSALVHRSRVNWNKFMEGLNEHKNTKTIPDRMDGYSRFINIIFDTHAVRFVEDEWFPYIHSLVGYRRHWTSSPMDLAFKADSIRFKESFWRQWACDWTGRSDAFDELLKQIIEGSK